MSLHLYVIRHGNTFDKGDTLLRVGGKTDLPLSTSGRQQAKALGIHLFKQHQLTHAQPPSQIYCSHLSRTYETASIALQHFHQSKQHPKPLDWLNEIDYGPDEGQPETKVLERIGQHALEQWEQHNIVPEGWRVDPVAIQQQWRQFLDEQVALYQLETQNKLETQSAAGAHQQHHKILWMVTSNGIARFIFDAININHIGPSSKKLRTAHYGYFLYKHHQRQKSHNAWKCSDWNVSSSS